jgi:hypothetical protein
MSVKCKGGCGVELKEEPNFKPKWYGLFKNDKCISGICVDCYKKEKKQK